MYKIVTINGIDYKVEYTIEASLYKDFVEKLTRFTVRFSGLLAKYDLKGKEIKNNEQMVDTSVEAVEEMMVARTTLIPELSRLGFYAGLIEHQNIDSKMGFELYKKYLQEYNKQPLDVLAEIMEKAKEDNFFTLIGLDAIEMKNPIQKNTATKKSHTKK